MKLLRLLSFLFFAFAGYPAFVKAQDLNCRVEILSPQIQSAEKTRVFGNLQKVLYNFMNNHKWVGQQLQPTERIDCDMILNVTSWDGGSTYQATAQVQSSRPVYGASYTTTVLNMNDRQWSFSYIEGQPIDYSENGTNIELANLLAYYANLIIGMDFDTFSLEGGTPYFLKAQGIVNQSQSSSSRGWRAYDELRNRYWMIENVLSPELKPFREASYLYHIKGLDQLSRNQDQAREIILSLVPSIKDAQNGKPNSMYSQIFFLSKVEEITNIFQKSPDVNEKNNAVTAFSDADPSNASKYQRINQ